MSTPRPSEERIQELWELVEATGEYRHLNPTTRSLCRERFLDGAAEHGDDWLNWPDTRFVDEADAEFADFVNYLAMRVAARAHQGATTTTGDNHQ